MGRMSEISFLNGLKYDCLPKNGKLPQKWKKQMTLI